MIRTLRIADLGLSTVAVDFSESRRVRVGEELPFVHAARERVTEGAETAELAAALRVLGMTARIGHHEPPEAIAAEARDACGELEVLADTKLRNRALVVAHWLVQFGAADTSDAQEFAARTLLAAADQLRDAIAFEQACAA